MPRNAANEFLSRKLDEFLYDLAGDVPKGSVTVSRDSRGNIRASYRVTKYLPVDIRDAREDEEERTKVAR